MAFSFGKMFGGGGGGSGAIRNSAGQDISAAFAPQEGAQGGGLQDILSQLGGLFGGGPQPQEAPLQPDDPGGASAALAAQLVQMLPQITRRPNMGLRGR